MDGQRKPYEGTEPYIFVSYARKDADRVFPLLDALSAAGYRIWYDVDGIPWNTDWADVIAEHIEKSAVVLAFHSEASNASRNCREEIYYTLGEEKELFSVYVDGVQFKRGLKMRLAPYQAVKLFEFADSSAFVARLGEEETFAVCCDSEHTSTLLPIPEGVHPAPKKEYTPSSTTVWHRDGVIQWGLDEEGVLTIERSGVLPDTIRYSPIPDYAYKSAPWSKYGENIRSVVIHSNINRIGNFSFLL